MSYYACMFNGMVGKHCSRYSLSRKNRCTKWDYVKHCSIHIKNGKKYLFKVTEKPLKKLTPKHTLNQKPINTYNFQGQISLPHLTNDCISDSKTCFITVGETALFGITKQIHLDHLQPWINFTKSTRVRNSTPFHIFQFNKSHTAFTMKFAEKVPDLVKSSIRKLARDLHKNKRKGLYSNKSITKVMVF